MSDKKQSTWLSWLENGLAATEQKINDWYKTTDLYRMSHLKPGDTIDYGGGVKAVYRPDLAGKTDAIQAGQARANKAFVQNVGPSILKNFVVDPAKAVYNLSTNSKARAQAWDTAVGTLHNATGQKPTNSHEKYQRDLAIEARNQIIAPYTSVDAQGNHHFDSDAFLSTLVTDPGRIVADTSLALDGAAALTKVGAGLTRFSPSVSDALSAASQASTDYGRINPLVAGVETAKAGASKVGKAVGPVVAGAYQKMSGVAAPLYRAAYSLKNADPELKAAFFRGSSALNPYDWVDTVDKALERHISDSISAYKDRFDDLNGIQIDTSNIKKSINNADDWLQRYSPDISKKIYNHIKNSVNYVKNSIGMSEDGSMPESIPFELADQIRDNLGRFKNVGLEIENGAGARDVNQAIGGLYYGVRDAISDVHPEYGDILSAGDKARKAANASKAAIESGESSTGEALKLPRILSSINLPNGQNMFDAISHQNPEIPYEAAGLASSHLLPIGIPGVAADLAPLVFEGFMNVASGHGLQGLLPAAIETVGTAAATSPKIGIGATRVASNVADAFKIIPPLPPSLTMAPILNAAGEGQRVGENQPLENLEAANVKVEPEIAPPPGYENSPEYNESTPLEQEGNVNAMPPPPPGYENDPEYAPPQRAAGGRIGFATGGSAKENFEPLICKLMSRAKKVKREINKSTEPLLNLHDNTVAKALAIAQKSI